MANNQLIKAAAGAIVFAIVWILLSALLSLDTHWLGGVLGGIAWFVTAVVIHARRTKK